MSMSMAMIPESATYQRQASLHSSGAVGGRGEMHELPHRRSAPQAPLVRGPPQGSCEQTLVGHVYVAPRRPAAIAQRESSALRGAAAAPPTRRPSRSAATQCSSRIGTTAATALAVSMTVLPPAATTSCTPARRPTSAILSTVSGSAHGLGAVVFTEMHCARRGAARRVVSHTALCRPLRRPNHKYPPRDCPAFRSVSATEDAISSIFL